MSAHFGAQGPTSQTLAAALGIGPAQAPQLNLGTPTLPLAPYLLIVITTNADSKLNRTALHAYLQEIASGENSKEKTRQEWLDFAREQNLMAGNHPLTLPDTCFIGGKRWITARWHADWEVHIHFGFVNTPNEKHSHINLAVDSKKWLPKMATRASHWYLFKPHVTGDALIVSYDTGVRITPRQSFMTTLKSKETLTAVAAFALSGGTWFVKNMNWNNLDEMYKNGAMGLGIIASFTLAHAAFKHFFTLPNFSWSVPELKD